MRDSDGLRRTSGLVVVVATITGAALFFDLGHGSATSSTQERGLELSGPTGLSCPEGDLIEDAIGEPDYADKNGFKTIEEALTVSLKRLSPSLAADLQAGNASWEPASSGNEGSISTYAEVGSDGKITALFDYVLFEEKWFEAGYLACTSVIGKDAR
jgi:hypothetical protein